MLVLFDSDYLLYSCGFGSEATVYDWIDSEGNQGIARTKDDIPSGASFETIKEPAPLSHALQMVRQTVLGVRNAVEARITEPSYILRFYLTGKGNFRDNIATINGYKANRKDLVKPHWYYAIREFIISEYGAVVVDGYEADDAVAIEAAMLGYDPNRVIIVSPDKDLMTVPGLKYNLKRKAWYDVTQQEALVTFYRQVLTGDAIDFYKGCYKCGPKRAEAAVAAEMTEYQMWQSVLAEYAASLSRPGCPYVHMTAEQAALENARLAHMQRSHGEVWNPPSDPSTKKPSPEASPNKVGRLTMK